jgi:peptidyl-prolyl cis-trans isomerase C
VPAPFRRSPTLSLIALLGLLALLAGCSPQGGELARVGEASITRDDFIAAARNAQDSYPGAADSAKAALLDDLVKRELLVQAAMARGLDKDTVFAGFSQRVEEQLLRERLFREISGGPAKVSDAEVDSFYRQRAQETRVRAIFTLAEGPAREAAQQLKAGQDFAAVADRFNMPGMIPPGGDLGYVQTGTLIPELDRHLVDAPIGSVIGPVEGTGQGWFLMRIEDRRPAQQPSLAEQRTTLSQMLRQRKERVMLLRGVEKLSKEYDVKVAQAGGQTMSQKLKAMSPTTPATPAQPLTPADKAIVIGTYNGGRYTLGDAVQDLQTSMGAGPNLDMLPMVEMWIKGQTLQRVALVEARKRRIHEDPEVRRIVRERANNYLLEAIYTREVIQKVSVEESDLRATHAQMADNFIRLDEVKIVTVALDDSASAAQLRAHAGQAASLREAAAAGAPRARVRNETIRYPNEDLFWGPLQADFMRMKPGEIGGPHMSPYGWMLIQLTSKDQKAQTFEDLPQMVRNQLHAQAVEVKREQRLTALTDSLRQSIKVTVHRDRLAKIPWPPPPAPGAQAPGAA